MKKLFTLILVVSALFCGCKNTDSTNVGVTNSHEMAKNEIEEVVPDLSGAWIQDNYEERGTFMYAAIGDGQIVILYSINDGETMAVYWAGSYVAPESAGEYTWESINDKTITDKSLLASSDDTKTFSYENDVISFNASIMGVTGVITLERASEEAVELISDQMKQLGLE